MNRLVIPDLGSADAIEIIEILAKEGDSIHADQAILMLESDKATIEVPAEQAGTLAKILVKVGDKVSSGQAYAELSATTAASQQATEQIATPAVSKAPASASTPTQPIEPTPSTLVSQPIESPPLAPTKTKLADTSSASDSLYAGPAVRKLARELGVELSLVVGSGLRARIQKEDVQNFVKQRLHTAGRAEMALPVVPDVDFSQFGPIATVPLSKIKRATAKAMTVANLTVPQVTQFDQADITELEALRVALNQEQGVKFSLVPFVLKALARCLEDFPSFNASLSADGESLILKNYIHLGVAVDTPKGLLVPVLRDVNTKSITEITKELQQIAEKARTTGLSLPDMQGGSFSLSSLGGIGGTAFTPIVNPPEVAILGLSKARQQPIWDGQGFVPRLMLPLSLSYDHRVIDGAEAARFSQRLVSYLQDLRRMLI